MSAGTGDGFGISSRPPETALEPAPAGAATDLVRALAAPAEELRRALGAVARGHPQWPDAWAALGESTADDVEAYAYFRVGYHRGLDALRKVGWRGSGYVRWDVAENRGFLRCLDGLRRQADAIGEDDEARRCEAFLRQLDPSWPPADMR